MGWSRLLEGFRGLRIAFGDCRLDSLRGWQAISGPRMNIGAVIARIGFLGPLYCNYNKDPPPPKKKKKSIVLVVIQAPTLRV